ncbi:MAG: endonuclease/exonuclease/phosphatase family protein [Bacteroidetes bacterium]|nr:endonuclease/exonuclease/phosphatase family protein [Bacteroidota bacterium]
MNVKLLIASFLLSPVFLQAQSVEVMSYNIRYDNPKDGLNAWSERKADVAGLLHYYQPDFVGVQEALLHQLSYLLAENPQYAFTGKGRDDGDEKGEFSAILYDSSRFELMESNTFWLSESPERVSVGWDASMERICSWGKFRERNTDAVFYVFNAHFDHIGEEARLHSAELILQRIEDLPESSRVVLTGDFNATPESAPIEVFRGGMDDVRELAGAAFYGPAGTFNHFDPAFVPEKRIDYIFIKNLQVERVRQIDDRRPTGLWVSDHLPVLAELSF